MEGAFYFSQIYTEEQNTQGFTETLSQPITQNLTANRSLTPSPSPNGEGSDHRGYPYFAACVLMGLCTLVRSVLLCNSVRERTQEARWKFYLSQIFTDEQRPFSEPLDPPRSHCPRLRGTAS